MPKPPDPGGTHDDNDGSISEETQLMVFLARRRAADVLFSASLPGLAADALQVPAGDMTATEIRGLATSAIEQAQQVSYLLGKLAGMLGEEGP